MTTESTEWTEGEFQTEPDISKVIQELVNGSGDKPVIRRAIYSYDGFPNGILIPPRSSTIISARFNLAQSSLHLSIAPIPWWKRLGRKLRRKEKP